MNQLNRTQYNTFEYTDHARDHQHSAPAAVPFFLQPETLFYLIQNTVSQTTGRKKMIGTTYPVKARVGVLLVNYNQWELTKKCVDSLLASDGVSVVIGLVDNSSGPVPDWVENTDELVFHKNISNVGLTAGNNKAFEMVQKKNVDFVFILNNDTEVFPDTVSLLVNYLQNHDETGITAPAIPYANRPDTIWSAGGRYSYARMYLSQIYKKISDLPDHPVEMEQVTGCAMMMRADDYKKAGRQDPDLFVYYEDTDLCFRVKKMGLNIQLIPSAIVLHHISISVGGIYSPFAIYFTHRNRFVVARRHLSRFSFFLFTLYYFAVTLLKTVLYPAGKKGNLVYWMWLGLIHGVNNRPDIRPERLFPSEEQP